LPATGRSEANTKTINGEIKASNELDFRANFCLRFLLVKPDILADIVVLAMLCNDCYCTQHEFPQIFIVYQKKESREKAEK
jgi:hypothetical protein